MSIDAALLQAWLTARSVARGSPMPVVELGGFRVETNTEAELRRWVFLDTTPGLAELGRRIDDPRCLLKFCGSLERFRAALPERWEIGPTAYFMKAVGPWGACEIPEGYVVEQGRDGAVIHVRIRSASGDTAASGHAAETDQAFVYDRIESAPEHRRKGLGRALMASLRRMRRNTDLPELLVATEEGRALYESLGWEVLSLYSTGRLRRSGDQFGQHPALEGLGVGRQPEADG